MGISIAPNYANLFMGKFEQDHIYFNNTFHSNIMVWMRYIDDSFYDFGQDLNQDLYMPPDHSSIENAVN